jgi:hypothetical protein
MGTSSTRISLDFSATLTCSQNEALACREGRDHVDRRVDTLFLTGPPQRLAVDGNHPLWRSGQRRNPGDEAALGLLGVEDRQDVAQMVVCVSERPEAAQKSELLAAEQSDIDERLGPSQYGEQAEQEDLIERMGHLALLARVMQILAMTQKNRYSPGSPGVINPA